MTAFEWCKYSVQLLCGVHRYMEVIGLAKSAQRINDTPALELTVAQIKQF